MVKFIKNLFCLGKRENRWKYKRYPIVALLEVTVGDRILQFEIQNVSAKGRRLSSVLAAQIGNLSRYCIQNPN